MENAGKMDYEFLSVDREGPIFRIAINRPEVMNALHRDAHFEMHHAFNTFASDPSLWVAILTGTGNRAFCAGYDLKSLANGGKEEWDSSGFGGITRRYDLNKPVIAAVNGVAFGGGFEMALACDIIVATEGASFALPEPRVGLAAVSGGLHRLPRQIGLKQAMGMILTGRRASASECLAMGLINEVVPGGDLMAACARWADEICKCSPMSIRAAKEAVRLGLKLDVDEAIARQTEFGAMKEMYSSNDFLEGPRAFAEKRPPRWQTG
jgi:enoyl-CoA hydratase/carnithine racemase